MEQLLLLSMMLSVMLLLLLLLLLLLPLLIQVRLPPFPPIPFALLLL